MSNEVWFDSMDYYTSATALQVYETYNSASLAGAGREGQRALSAGTTTKSRSPSTSGAFGFALKFTTGSPGSNSGDQAWFVNNNNNELVGWGALATGLPYINLPTIASKTFGDGSFFFNVQDWFYIVLIATLGDDGSGHVTVSASLYVDGTLRVSASSSNIGSTSSPSLTHFYGFGSDPGGTWCDLFYSNDATVWWPNLVVLSYAPTGDGFYGDWTPSAAGTHFSKLTDNPADGDTTYISSGSVGDKDTHTYSFTPVSGTIVGVQLTSDMRQDAAGTADVTQMFRTGGVDYPGTDSTLSSNYRQYFWSELLNPATGVAWVASDITGGEWGENHSA